MACFFRRVITSVQEYVMHTTLPFQFKIRRSKRAKKVRLIVRPDQIELVAPVLVSENLLLEFVQARQSWAMQAQEKLQSEARTRIEQISDFKHGGTLYFHGRDRHLQLLNHDKTGFCIKIEVDKIQILCPSNVKLSGALQPVKQAFLDWLKQGAMGQIQQMVAQHAPKYHLFPRRICLKNQKTRWGSCGIHNDIFINWKLAMAPVQVLEYVVVHELCHIKERNHSARFWNLVAEHMSDYQQHRNWLKQQGHLLGFEIE